MLKEQLQLATAYAIDGAIVAPTPRNGEYLHTLDPQRERDPLQVEWERAPIEIDKFAAGKVDLGDGTQYWHREGEILRVLRNVDGKLVREPVMSTCEFDWAKETVNLAFGQIKVAHSTPIRVLEFGIGLRITANRVIEQFRGHGKGEYHGVELNKEVLEKVAVPWRKRKMNEFSRVNQEIPGSGPDIKIHLYQGDADEWAEELVKRGEKFHIIISDTYPLTDIDTGFNDLHNLDIKVQLLEKGGCFAFFPGSPESIEEYDGKIREKMMFEQNQRLSEYFEPPILLGFAQQDPPEEYEYAWVTVNGIKRPIRRIPVVVATQPKFT